MLPFHARKTHPESRTIISRLVECLVPLFTGILINAIVKITLINLESSLFSEKPQAFSTLYSTRLEFREEFDNDTFQKFNNERGFSVSSVEELE